MTVPAAPAEAGGDKIIFLVWDNAGVNAAALMRAIAQATLNGENVGHLGVASHGHQDTHGGVGEPVLLMAGVDGSTIRSLLADPTGRLIARPPAAYDNAGSIAFAHQRGIGQTTLDSEPIASAAVATHVAAGTFGGTDPVVVLGGVDGSTIRAILASTDGRLLVKPEPTFGGSGHKDIGVTNTAVALGASLAVREVLVKADSTNSNVMYLGISGVTRDETEATGGFRLAAGQEARIPVSNRATVFINGVAGEGVSYLYWV